jgi:hypothetical protein
MQLRPYRGEEGRARGQEDNLDLSLLGLHVFFGKVLEAKQGLVMLPFLEPCRETARERAWGSGCGGQASTRIACPCCMHSHRRKCTRGPARTGRNGGACGGYGGWFTRRVVHAAGGSRGGWFTDLRATAELGTSARHHLLSQLPFYAGLQAEVRLELFKALPARLAVTVRYLLGDAQPYILVVQAVMRHNLHQMSILLGSPQPRDFPPAPHHHLSAAAGALSFIRRPATCICLNSVHLLTEGAPALLELVRPPHMRHLTGHSFPIHHVHLPFGAGTITRRLRRDGEFGHGVSEGLVFLL